MAGEHAETDRPEGPCRPRPGSTHVPWRRGAPRIQQMEEPARTAVAIREPSISTRGLAPLVPAGSSICLDPGSPPCLQGTQVLHTAQHCLWGHVVTRKREGERRVTRRWGVDTQVYTHTYTRVGTHVDRLTLVGACSF